MNEDIRRFAKVREINSKAREARAEVAVDTVMLRDDNHILKRVFEAKLEEKRSRGRQRL